MVNRKTLFATIVLMGVFLPSVISTNAVGTIGNQTIGDNSIASSEDGDREVWFNPHWHNRIPMDVSGGDYGYRAGAPIEHVVTEIESNVDPNSIRVVYDGIEIPSDYVPSEKKVIFTVDKALAPYTNRRYTLYYDTIDQGIKAAPEYDPTWVTDYVENQAYKDEQEAKYEQEKAEIEAEIEENRIHNNSGIYTWREYTVYFNGTDWVYEDNGTLLPEYMYFEPISRTWYLINGTTGETMVYFIEGTGQNVLMESSFDNSLTGAILNEEEFLDDWEVGNVKAKGFGHAIYTNSTGSIFTQTVSATAYRDVPVMSMDVTSDAANKENGWGKAMFNLNGSVLFNGTYLDYLNYEDYINANLDANTSEFEDDVASTMNDARRYKVLTEGGAVEYDNSEWNVDNVNVYDVTSNTKYSTGRTHVPGDTVKCKPFLLKTRYFGLYDIIDKRGIGFVFPGLSSFSRVLIEVLQEVLVTGEEYYYLIISLNQLDFTLETIEQYLDQGAPGYEDDISALLNAMDPEDKAEIIALIDQYNGSLHLPVDGDFSFYIGYIMDLFPTNWLNNLLDEVILVRPKPHCSHGVREKSLPINVIVHKPLVGQRFKNKRDIEIDLTVLGETVLDIFYKWGVGTRVQFRGAVRYWENSGTYATEPHYANEVSVAAEILDGFAGLGTGEQLLSIMAQDTNGTFVLASVPIVIENEWEAAGWISGLIAVGFIAGIAVMYSYRRMKQSRSSNVKKIDGARCARTSDKSPASRKTPSSAAMRKSDASRASSRPSSSKKPSGAACPRPASRKL